jgi:hypothetical protein
MSPSLLRNSSRSDYTSSLQPINRPYSTYPTEYPGGGPGENNDRIMEDVERFRLLPPILGPEKKTPRPSPSYSDNGQLSPPQQHHHHLRSHPITEVSPSFNNRDQEGKKDKIIQRKKTKQTPKG